MKQSMVVQMAEEVLCMHGEILRLRAEVEELREYRKKYSDELIVGIEHGQHMMGGLLKIALTEGVMDSLRKANEAAP